MEKQNKKRRTCDLNEPEEVNQNSARKLLVPFGTVRRTEPVFGIFYDTIDEEWRTPSYSRNKLLERLKFLLNEFTTIHTMNSNLIGIFGISRE